MRGGAGNDIYLVADVSDVVIENAGEGIDRINTLVDYTNPDNVESLVGKFARVGLTLTGSDARETIVGANKINSGDDISGNGGDDRLVGLVGNDAIDGGAGADALFGNSGDDVLNGGAGDDNIIGSFGLDRMIGGVGRDVLRGGANADTFVHGTGDGSDVILDFSTEDVLDVQAHSFANHAAIRALMADTAEGLLITLNSDGDSLLLTGVQEANLSNASVLI